MISHIRNIIRSWLPLAAAVTLMTGVLYAVSQQVFRLAADDPQVQLAEDAATALEAGEPAGAVVPDGTVDIAASLAPYVIVFDAQGEPVASNARLHDEIPELPGGVLDFAREHGGNRISYQPEPGVRSATVIVPVNGGADGYVLAGRSLREVEAREAQLVRQLVFGWAGTLFGVLVVVSVVEVLPFLRRKA
jgi:hypothetical protein